MTGKFSNFQDKIGTFRLVWSSLDSRLETFWPLWPDFFFKRGCQCHSWIFYLWCGSTSWSLTWSDTVKKRKMRNYKMIWNIIINLTFNFHFSFPAIHKNQNIEFTTVQHQHWYHYSSFLMPHQILFKSFIYHIFFH